MSAQAGLMPDDVLNLNVGQVQAVIEGYNERVLDDSIQSVWTGYYTAYYISSKHSKKPTELIRAMIDTAHKNSSRGNTTQETDINAEIEKFAQRDLRFLTAKEGNN